jgi:hypothetical protein
MWPTYHLDGYPPNRHVNDILVSRIKKYRLISTVLNANIPNLLRTAAVPSVIRKRMQIGGQFYKNDPG